MCQTDLIEERPVSFEDAVQWTKNWMQSVLGTPLAFVAVVASVVIIQALLGFVGRVPVLGAPLWGLFTPITLVTSLIGGLAVVALAYSLPIYIPLIYTERTTPLDTLTRLLELLREQGVRIIGSLFGMMALTAAATAVVLYPAWMIAVDLATRVGTATMGPSLGQSAAHVPDSFTPWMVFFLKSPGHVGTTTTDGGQVAAGAIMGVMVTVGPAIFFGALALVLCASGCIIYSMATGRRKE
jgi:hypothetical protein